MDGSDAYQTHPIVVRMRGMYPSDLAGYEAHRLRKGGDIGNVDKRLIGPEDWAHRVRERIAEMALENLVAEVESLKARKRKKDMQRRILEGPKQPWRPTRHGPLREVILTANRAWFDDEMAKFLGENRETDFEVCALKWLRDSFGDDVVHARCDRDETTYHIHAVVGPETVVETEADRDAARERARVQAIVQTLLRWLAKLDESTRAAIFSGLEEVATTRDRTLIAEHALRPDTTDTQPPMTLRADRATPPSEGGAAPKSE